MRRLTLWFTNHQEPGRMFAPDRAVSAKPQMPIVSTSKYVIYLDFDGVLQHEAVYYHPKRGIYIKEPGFSMFEWMPVLESILESYPDVAIVLSTSWVRSKSFNFAKFKLSPALQKRVIGSTFHRHYMNSESFAMLPRGVQIANDVERRKPEFWFAIDDDFESWPERIMDNLIVTKGAMGLSEPSVQEAIRAKLRAWFPDIDHNPPSP